jgi:hypothetical protein
MKLKDKKYEEAVLVMQLLQNKIITKKEARKLLVKP